jgi:hypothetical protein
MEDVMRAQIVTLAVIAALAPIAVQAQPLNRNLENQLRMQQAQEQLRQQQQNAPAQQAEQRLNDLDQRVRTQQNIDNIAAPRGPTYQPMDLTAAQAITGGIDLSAQSTLMARELAGETQRLRALNPPR